MTPAQASEGRVQPCTVSVLLALRSRSGLLASWRWRTLPSLSSLCTEGWRQSMYSGTAKTQQSWAAAACQASACGTAPSVFRSLEILWILWERIKPTSTLYFITICEILWNIKREGTERGGMKLVNPHNRDEGEAEQCAVLKLTVSHAPDPCHASSTETAVQPPLVCSICGLELQCHGTNVCQMNLQT